MIYLIWAVTLVLALVLYFRGVYSKFSDYGVKHETVVPPFGTMYRILLGKEHFGYIMTRMFQKFSTERFIGLYEFIKPMVLIRDLELIKKIAVKDFDSFVDHRSFVEGGIDSIVHRNLFSMKGAEWKDMRATLSPAFTSSKIKLMVPFMEEIGEQTILAIRRNIKESNAEYLDVDCKDLASRHANDVIASCAFGLKVDSQAERNNQFYEMGKIVSTFSFRQIIVMLSFSVMPTISKMLNLKLFSDDLKNFFSNLVLDTMKDRESRNIIRPDMIHLLMEAKKGQLMHDEKDANSSVGDAGFATVEESAVGKRVIKKAWSDNDLVAQALIFFAAGFETVSSAMSFALHEIALRPDVQEKLLREIKETDAKNGGKIDYNTIQNMTYLDMVVSEVLRLWPALIVTDRCCIQNYNLGKPNDKAPKDFILRKGDIVQIPVWLLHRDPQYFPDPDTFDPERFSKENKHRINPLTYLPFGIGPRNCIGSRFALCEVKVFLYYILRDMELIQSPKIVLPSRLAKDSWNPRLEGGHWVQFKPRH